MIVQASSTSSHPNQIAQELANILTHCRYLLGGETNVCIRGPGRKASKSVRSHDSEEK